MHEPKEPFRNHTELCCELIDWVCDRNIPGDFAFDCYFTNAESSTTSDEDRSDAGAMSAT